MTEHSDHILLTYWYRNRNAEAFRVLASRHAQMVYATALRILKNPTEAEDIAQESFLELASTSRPPKRNAGAWLHKITYHKALNYLRTAKRRQARDKQYVLESEDTQTQEWNDVKQHLDAILTELPEKYREPIVLHFFEEQQHADIADTLKVSRQTVTHRIGKGSNSCVRSLRLGGSPCRRPPC
ncbi:MAG: RNA polymerase sigma factor [Candidatus Hydrogenedentota bacterium]